MFQSYWKAVTGPPSAPPRLMAVFWSMPTACSNGSRLIFWTKVKWKGTSGHDPAGRPGLRHRVVHLPVLVANGRWGRAREIEEEVARRFVAGAFEVSALVEAVERGLDDAGVRTGLDLRLQPVALGPAGDI